MRVRLTDLGYAAGWRLVRALPLPVARALFTTVADRAARANGPATQRLRRNLRTVVGPDLPDAELDALVRAGLRSYARYWMEAFRLPALSRQQILDGFHFPGRGAVDAAIAAGQGAVLALPHMGNWDLAAAWCAASGWRLISVAERLRPASLFDRFVAYRESLGMEIVPLTGGQRAPLDVLAERIGQGYVVALLADRDLSARGVEVQFFGGRTRMPPGPALLALRTGAPLFAARLHYDATRCHAAVHPIELPAPAEGPLDVRVRIVTQRLADAFATAIAAHPEDWHMLQKLWLDQPARV